MNTLERIKKEVSAQRAACVQTRPPVLDDMEWLIAEVERLQVSPVPDAALLVALRWALPLAWDAITNGREALSYSDANKQIDADEYKKARAAIAQAEAAAETEAGMDREGKCDQCDQNALVPGACYDHVKMCGCGNPMHPDAMDCAQCYKDRQSKNQG